MAITNLGTCLASFAKHAGLRLSLGNAIETVAKKKRSGRSWLSEPNVRPEAVFVKREPVGPGGIRDFTPEEMSSWIKEAPALRKSRKAAQAEAAAKAEEAAIEAEWERWRQLIKK